jgi:hypothetical protein
MHPSVRMVDGQLAYTDDGKVPPTALRASGLTSLVASMLKRKADAPMPVMTEPVTMPFFVGNHRLPVMKGCW